MGSPPGSAPPATSPADVNVLHAAYHRTRDPKLRERLLLAHHSLAVYFAQRFAHRGEPLDDLEQVASMALLKAVDRFDPTRDIKFATYAARVVTGELKRHFRDRTWAMRVPRSLQELHLRVKNASEFLRGDLGRSPSVAELATFVGTSEERVLEAMEAGDAYRLTSLDAPAAGSDDIHIQVGGDDPAMAAFEQRALLEPLLARLEERDQVIVRLYYVHNLSQADIGSRLGLSQVHVSRRLAKILERLRTLAQA
ncbi:MAG TPA: sigma-70 family RNA polymerase sigma factor [Acidimicrobiales bacterium]|nr:sigma-70 family RNA polymerase sigma factor [Acidimicrobiales bacterium]